MAHHCSAISHINNADAPTSITTPPPLTVSKPNVSNIAPAPICKPSFQFGFWPNWSELSTIPINVVNSKMWLQLLNNIRFFLNTNTWFSGFKKLTLKLDRPPKKFYSLSHSLWYTYNTAVVFFNPSALACDQDCWNFRTKSSTITGLINCIRNMFF